MPRSLLLLTSGRRRRVTTLHQGHSNLSTLLLIGEDLVIQVHRIIQREFQLDVAPTFPGPHVSGDLLLLLFLPLNLLGSFLLPGVRLLLLGDLPGLARWSLREVRPGLVPPEPLRNDRTKIKEKGKE